ncbi:MAG: zinc ribbon domain-containing protein [Anaerolineales bacterium]
MIQSEHDPLKLISVTKRVLQSILMSLIFLTTLWLINVSAQSEGQIQLENVKISLIPEFNHESIRVIFEISLQEGLPFPQELTLYIPADAQILNTVNFDQEGHSSDVEIEVANKEESKELHILTDTPTIQIEYDDPNLIKQGNLRTLAFQWKSDHPVTALSVSVRQPLGASEIYMDPPLFEKMMTNDGFRYYIADLGTIPAGEVRLLTLNYVKDISDPSFPALKVAAAAPVTSGTPGRTSSPTFVITWLLAFAALVLILVGAYYWWFRVNISNKYDRVMQDMGMINTKNQVLFCQECGNRSRPGDNYCSKCGTTLNHSVSTEPHTHH